MGICLLEIVFLTAGTYAGYPGAGITKELQVQLVANVGSEN